MDKKLVGLIFLFLMSFAVFSTLVVFNRPLTQLTRAREDTAPSASESLLIVRKSSTEALTGPVKANGQDSAEVVVFVRNSARRNLENKPVELTTTTGQVLEGIVKTKEGNAVFHVTSTAPGTAEIAARVNDGEHNVLLDQKAVVVFQ